MAYILVVEDDPEINALIKMTLRIEDYEVAQARDGQQALQMIAERLPDLILLDVMMPRLSGYEVARTLQNGAATRHIPLIFVTAKSDMEDRVRGLEMAIDYICKPFAVPELIARVRAALRMGKLQEELRASNEKLAQLATTDSLTGLCNRRHFYLELEDEIQRARRFGQPMSVIMFDLDHFKRINDSWGHSHGDLVLQAFSRVLESTKRSIDTVARLGGEEFVALLPATGFDGAYAFAEKVRLATEKMSVPGSPAESDATADSKITVSAGAAVAVRLEPGEEGQETQEDAALSPTHEHPTPGHPTPGHPTPGHPAPHLALHNAQHNVPHAAMNETSVANDDADVRDAIDPNSHEMPDVQTPASQSVTFPSENASVESVESGDVNVWRHAASSDTGSTLGIETVSERSSVRSALQDAAMRAVQNTQSGSHDLQDVDAKLSSDGQTFMKVADRLLYQSKAAGRNCTTAEVIFEAPPLPASPSDAPPVSEIVRL